MEIDVASKNALVSGFTFKVLEWEGGHAPVKNPWSGVVCYETDGDLIAFRLAEGHNVPLNGIQEVEASSVSASDDTEPMLY